MTKKKLGPGKCVHCLKDVGERNSDHVFPESWYPDSTLPDVEKWQVPSCIPCNRDYGKLEQDFLIKVGLCLDPHDAASASIVQKALRSLKPAAARNPRDAQHRLGRGKRILAQALQGDQIPDHGVFPGMGDRWTEVPGERIALLIPKESFERITEKIVRGIYFIEDGLFIEPPYTVEFYALPEEGITAWTDALDRWGKVYAREPGIIVRRAVAYDDGMSSLFEITFWKQFKTYAIVSKTPEQVGRISKAQSADFISNGRRTTTSMKKATTTMKKTKTASKEAKGGASPSQLIDARIKKLGDWRGEILARVRKLIKEACPDVVEEVKWRKPSNMLGVPVWEHGGIICTGETYKDKVKLTFAKGAALEDPSRLFNSSLDGNARRALDIHEGDKIDEKALKALIRAAAALNTSVRAKAGPARSQKNKKSA